MNNLRKTILDSLNIRYVQEKPLLFPNLKISSKVTESIDRIFEYQINAVFVYKAHVKQISDLEFEKERAINQIIYYLYRELREDFYELYELTNSGNLNMINQKIVDMERKMFHV